ncbi:MAG: hypothetical protein GXO81_11705 [Chlorobi bacterium]|nr:hypothetical protein [Chlorobiota bacterium]
MAWTKIKKSYFSSAEPVISINNNRFSYNSVFSKIAELEKNSFVTYYVDEENRKIGFEFKNIEDEYAFKINLNKSKGNYSQSNELFSKDWIQKISKIKEVNRFKPIKDGNKFVITLLPVFEFRVLRTNYLKIPSEASGIYRYIDNNNIVYIGKGKIRNRLKELSRKDWQFDTIEYSIIGDADLQFEWERFWIEQFKGKNENRLPAYNLISGKIQ